MTSSIGVTLADKVDNEPIWTELTLHPHVNRDNYILKVLP